MPLNRITGNAFSGSPLRRGYTPPQPSYERIQGISRRLQEVLANPGAVPMPNYPGRVPPLQQVAMVDLKDLDNPSNQLRLVKPFGSTGGYQLTSLGQQAGPVMQPMSAAVRQGPATREEAGRIAGLEGLRGRIGLNTDLLQNVLEDPAQRWKPPAPQQNFTQGLQQFSGNNWSGYGAFAQEPGGINTYRSPLQPAPPEIDLSPAARNQRTSLGVGRMMPGGEQMQDRFMGSSPLAAQANYLSQGQALAAAGLGTMVPGPYGQIGQFIPKRQGVMEDVEDSMPGRLLTPTDQPASGFTRRNEGGLAYTSRAQALRDAGQERAAQDLERQQAERVARVKRDREAAGLPVGPAARRAERDQKKMDRIAKIEARRAAAAGINLSSPMAAVQFPAAFNRAQEAMQGGAEGTSSLMNASGQPITPVEQRAPRTPTSINNANEAYRALLQTPLFKSAGIEPGQEGGNAPALRDVVPKMNAWLKENEGSASEQDLENLHQLAIQAAHNATKSNDPFKEGWSPLMANASETTRESLERMKELSVLPLRDKKGRQNWWNKYSRDILGINRPPTSPLQDVFTDPDRPSGRPPLGDTDWGQSTPGIMDRIMQYLPHLGS